jgi:hypothetical protein
MPDGLTLLRVTLIYFILTYYLASCLKQQIHNYTEIHVYSMDGHDNK